MYTHDKEFYFQVTQDLVQNKELNNHFTVLYQFGNKIFLIYKRSYKSMVECKKIGPNTYSCGEAIYKYTKQAHQKNQ